LVRDNIGCDKNKKTGYYSIEYGIEKYFINENTKAPKIDDKVEVILIVGEDLTPRIKNLIVNDVEFKQ